MRAPPQDHHVSYAVLLLACERRFKHETMTLLKKQFKLKNQDAAQDIYMTAEMTLREIGLQDAGLLRGKNAVALEQIIGDKRTDARDRIRAIEVLNDMYALKGVVEETSNRQAVVRRVVPGVVAGLRQIQAGEVTLDDLLADLVNYQALRTSGDLKGAKVDSGAGAN
jgi:hypothetical protein